MYNKICAICGKEFESQYIRSKYCRYCQALAYRQKNTNRARERRAEARDAELEYLQQQAEERRKEREKEFEKREAERMRKLEQKAKNGDPLAIMDLLMFNESSDHRYNIEYWKAYQDYQRSQDGGGRFEHVVNGVSCFDEYFPELVIEAIKKEKGKIVTATIFHTH